MPRVVSLGLQIRLSADTSDEELLNAVRALQGDLERFDVSIEPAPSGVHARPRNLSTICGLTLAVFPLALPRVIDFLEAWARRDERRAITLEVDVDGRIVVMHLPARENGVTTLDQLLAAAVA
jgi:hypothetical protein